MPNKLKKYALKMKKKHLKIINKMGLLRKKNYDCCNELLNIFKRFQTEKLFY